MINIDVLRIIIAKGAGDGTLNNCALHSRYFSDELDALFF